MQRDSSSVCWPCWVADPVAAATQSVPSLFLSTAIEYVPVWFRDPQVVEFERQQFERALEFLSSLKGCSTPALRLRRGISVQPA